MINYYFQSNQENLQQMVKKVNGTKDINKRNRIEKKEPCTRIPYQANLHRLKLLPNKRGLKYQNGSVF